MQISSTAGPSLSQLLAQLQAKLQAAQTGDTATTAAQSSAATATTVSENPAFFLPALSQGTMDGLLQGQSGHGHGFQPPSLDAIDTDGDGSISKAEMEAYGQSVHGDADTGKADDIFGKMDADGDGVVSADEKTAFDDQMKTQGPRGAGGPPPGPPPTDQASAEGSDGSQGSLSDLMQQLLKALDAYNSSSGAVATASAASTTISVDA